MSFQTALGTMMRLPMVMKLSIMPISCHTELNCLAGWLSHFSGETPVSKCLQNRFILIVGFGQFVQLQNLWIPDGGKGGYNNGFLQVVLSGGEDGALLRASAMSWVFPGIQVISKLYHETFSSNLWSLVLWIPSNCLFLTRPMSGLWSVTTWNSCIPWR